jgi:hypothetical protein
MFKKKRLIIEKQETSDTTTTKTFDTDISSYALDSDYNTNTTNDTIDEQVGGKESFVSIVNTNYKKPRGGTVQDNMTTEEIRKQLESFIPLKTMQDKKVLETLPLFKTWIRYINRDTKQYRTGGLLMKVIFPDYIMLVNPAKHLTWSVQLSDNVIFIRDPELLQSKQEQLREHAVKNKLFEMYKRGELYAKKNRN